MQKIKVPFNRIIAYVIMTLLLNFTASILGDYIPRAVMMLLLKIFPDMSALVFNLLGYIFVILLTLLASWVCFYFYFRWAVPNWFVRGTNEAFGVKYCLKASIPAEIVRYAVCLFSLGLNYFALIPTLLFEQTYMEWSGRYTAIRLSGKFIPEDYLAFSLCYIIYFAVYFVGIVLLFRHFWKKEIEERKIH